MDMPPVIQLSIDEYDDHLVLAGHNTTTDTPHPATVTMYWQVAASPDSWEVRTTTVQDGAGEEHVTQGQDLDYLDSGNLKKKLLNF